MTSTSLFTCYRQHTSTQQQEVCCSVKTDWVTAVVLTILGSCMFFVGIYLMFGGIGTIPATLGGCILTLGGISGIISSIVLASKS